MHGSVLACLFSFSHTQKCWTFILKMLLLLECSVFHCFPKLHNCSKHFVEKDTHTVGWLTIWLVCWLIGTWQKVWHVDYIQCYQKETDYMGICYTRSLWEISSSLFFVAYFMIKHQGCMCLWTFKRVAEVVNLCSWWLYLHPLFFWDWNG